MKEKEFLNEIKNLYPEAEIRNGSDHYKVLLSKGFTTVARHPSQEIPKKHCLNVLSQLKIIKQREEIEEAKAQNVRQWAEEVRKLNLVQDAKIYEDPKEQGSYRGIILHKDPAGRFCVQQIASQSLVIHDGRKFEKLPDQGDVVQIFYKGEKAQVNVLRERNHGQERSK
ncbi:MAG: hypothetical protein LBL51_02740 [Synergistaceae bacterium]|jgi:hypothetical protein|nr:hypothetical protein [Synergistaceae bacterium]